MQARAGGEPQGRRQILHCDMPPQAGTDQDFNTFARNMFGVVWLACWFDAMQDWKADWNRWSRAERVLAVVMAFMLIALPLGFLLGTTALLGV